MTTGALIAFIPLIAFLGVILCVVTNPKHPKGIPPKYDDVIFVFLWPVIYALIACATITKFTYYALKYLWTMELEMVLLREKKQDKRHIEE